MSLFGVILVRIQSECGKIGTRINPNTVSFHAVNSTNFYPLDTGRKLNVDETYGRPPGRLKSVLYTLNFRLDTNCNFRISFLLWWISILKEFDVVNFAYKFKISICFTKLGNYSYLDKILSKSYKYKNFHIFPNHCLFSFDCNNSPSQ